MTTTPPSFPPTATGRWTLVRRSAGRLFRSAYRSLSDFGWLWVGQVPAEPPPPGPPPGHPERLCDDRPLTPVERALDRQLRG